MDSISACIQRGAGAGFWFMGGGALTGGTLAGACRIQVQQCPIYKGESDFHIRCYIEHLDIYGENGDC